MRSAASEYELVNAQTLSEALRLLSEGAGWRPIAGGTDLMVQFNAGKLPFERLVGIQNLADLRQIEVIDAGIIVGAAVTYSEIRRHPVLQSEFPLLCKAAGWTGGAANQNRGTLGGNIANASPAADSAPMLLVYDAEIELTSMNRVRWLPYADFHLSYKAVRMEPHELITRIRLPRRPQRVQQYARKVGTRKAQAISKACFAGLCEYEDGALRRVRVAVGSVAPIPLRCLQTECFLDDRLLTKEVIVEAKQTLRGEIHPITDIRSTSQYRSQVVINLLGEFLEGLR